MTEKPKEPYHEDRKDDNDQNYANKENGYILINRHISFGRMKEMFVRGMNIE